MSGGSRSGGGGDPGGKSSCSCPWPGDDSLASLVLSLRRGLIGAKKCLGLLSACCVAFVVMATVSMSPISGGSASWGAAFRAILGIVCWADVGTKVVIVMPGGGRGGGGEQEGDDWAEYLRCENGDWRL